MRYTRYWSRTKTPITQECVDAIKKIINDCTKKGIKICGPDGTGNPVLNTNTIAFNGTEENDLDHESFWIDNTDDNFNFCKTARKPYDYAVRRSLSVLKKYGIVTNVRSDGANNEIISDAEYLNKNT